MWTVFIGEGIFSESKKRTRLNQFTPTHRRQSSADLRSWCCGAPLVVWVLPRPLSPRARSLLLLLLLCWCGRKERGRFTYDFQGFLFFVYWFYQGGFNNISLLRCAQCPAGINWLQPVREHIYRVRCLLFSVFQRWAWENELQCSANHEFVRFVVVSGTVLLCFTTTDCTNTVCCVATVGRKQRAYWTYVLSYFPCAPKKCSVPTPAQYSSMRSSIQCLGCYFNVSCYRSTLISVQEQSAVCSYCQCNLSIYLSCHISRALESRPLQLVFY